MNYRVNDDQFLAYHVEEEEEEEIRKGPWTEKEDSILIDYINRHGQGRWNSIARNAVRRGLKRSGKSCRLRWLNYLRPDIKRENFTLQEQLTILKLHFRWGNRWSKIAELLPGRTDNDIKNYWRTRVKKQAKQLKMDVNSKQFQDAMRYIWIPRLEEQIIGVGATSHDNHHIVNSASTSTITDNSRDIPLIMPSNNKGTLTISSEVAAVSFSTDSVPLVDYYLNKENSINCLQYSPADEILAPQIPLLIHETNNSTLVDQDFLILGDFWNHSSSY